MTTISSNIAQAPENIRSAAAHVADFLSGRKPVAGIVLGSGLGRLADALHDPIVLPYSQIPGFPLSTAVGHKGNLICGELGGKCVLAMQGRFHYFEGYTMEQVTLPIRVMAMLGVEYLLVSNAAGGANFGYHVGDLMIIKDHINLLPNPLVGPNLDAFGTRFPDMTHTYDPALRRKAREIAADLGIAVHEGVYIAGTGPSYETPAEYRYFRTIGGDAVGMSTIPEVIVARHCGLRVFGMSVITNEAHDFGDDYVNDGADVVVQADAAAGRMQSIFEKLIASL